MNTALLFPGQGSQEPGMGRDAAERDKSVMALWKKAESACRLDLRAVYWEGNEKDMEETAHLQPALTVVNLGLWSLLAGKVTPSATAGHSLGEYSALAAAGVLPAEKILQLVALRGRLMSQADPEGKGGMAAVVKLPLEKVSELVEEAHRESGEMILVANHNTPAQFVVSGLRRALETLQEKVKNAKGRAVPLAVSGAFHSPLMNEASAEMAAAIDALPKSDWNKARFPVYCNADPAPQREPEVIKALLKRQMTSPVFWITSIRRQWDEGCRAFVECGPKGVLSKMTGPILKEHPAAMAAHGDDAPAWTTACAGNLQQALEYSA